MVCHRELPLQRSGWAELGAPFGAKIAQNLDTFAKARCGEDVLQALNRTKDTWQSDAAGAQHQTTQVTLDGGAFVGWSATAFFDITVNAARTQILAKADHAFLLDQDGNDATGEDRSTPRAPQRQRTQVEASGSVLP